MPMLKQKQKALIEVNPDFLETIYMRQARTILAFEIKEHRGVYYPRRFTMPSAK